MGLLSAIFGAKPPIGTPPFAPPHPNTGGAEIPTTPETLPAKHGLAGFIDRVLNPTNGLGELGQALMASGGGPLGNAMQMLMQQHFAKAHQGDQFNSWKQQYDYELSHPKQTNHEPHFWESNDGSLHAVDPDSGEIKEVFHDPTPKMNFIPDGMGGGQWVAVPNALPSGTPTPVGKITPLDDPAPANAPPAGGTVDYNTFKHSIIGQESGGRYGVANAQGSGAMGLGQIMPGTARVLAGRLGLPYQPNLLAGTGPASQDYQNRITDAAAREAWQAGGGDPAQAAMYYFGGSNRAKWGPKTRRYASDILGRLGG
jgi:hypothetical protein